jgi:3'(2'), 5'-bisphosphate nucleotidase
MSYEREREVAVEAVLQAAQLCERVRRERVPEAIAKSDKSPVTVADFGSQATICHSLAAAFPNDPVVGEEDATQLRSPATAAQLEQVTRYVQGIVGDATPETVLDWIDWGNGQVDRRYWTLDPIDGTKGFLRQEQYAVALALIEEGEVKVGVLACPALPVDPKQPEGERGILFVAVRGQGATMLPIAGGDPRAIQVVRENDLANLRFVESVESGHGDRTRQAMVAKAVGITADSLRMDSQAKYGAVASGRAALYLRLPSPKTPDYREKIWDHAAGAIVVEEAGGKVTDMYGQPLNFTLGSQLVENQGMVVSNGAIHETVLAALRETAK